jgi:hypothetical protein
MGPLESITIPPLTFGDGWMSGNASDLCKVAIAFGGFEPAEIVLAVHKLQRDKSAKANTATVEKALQMVFEAHMAADPELYADYQADRQAAMDMVKKLNA